MTSKILPNMRALLIEDDVKILVISDLHLKDDNDDVYNMIRIVKELIKNHKPDMLVINGDAFDFGMGGASFEVFINEISPLVKLQTLMGNHDPEIFPTHLTTSNYCICHGDFDFNKEKKNLILAHTHPFLDDRPVFLKGELKDGRKFIVLPPFNPKEGGPDIKEKNFLLGFIFRKDLIKECLVYNLEGKKIAKMNY